MSQNLRQKAEAVRVREVQSFPSGLHCLLYTFRADDLGQ